MGLTLAPRRGRGLDLQNNGGYSPKLGRSIDPSGPRPLDEADLHVYYDESFAIGVFPFVTLITQPVAASMRHLEVAAKVSRARGITKPCIHYEGLMLNPEGLAMGAHKPGWAQPADRFLVDMMMDYSGGQLAILTVGADVPDVCEAIDQMVRVHGRHVWIGHHNATETQIKEAISAGASCFVHLGDGTPPNVGRQGFLEYSAVIGLRAGIITDNVHLKDWYLASLVRQKGIERLVIVSDRSAKGGAPPTPEGEWEDLWGSDVRIVQQGDTYMIIGKNGRFAGSWAHWLYCINHFAARTQAWAELNAEGHVVVSENEICQAAFVEPLRTIGWDAAEFDEMCGRIGVAELEYADRRVQLIAA